MSSSMTMKDSMDKVDAAFMAAAGGLAVATAAAGTAGMFVATYDNYESDAPLWEVLLAATGVIGAVWTEVEVIRALYQQVVTAKRTAAANETLAAQLADLSDMQVAAQGYATIADNLVSMFTADQVNLNELKYTGGTVGDYCKARIIGAENLLELFAGKGTLGGTQSIVAMDPENIKLIVGTPLLEPSVLLSAEEITLTVGPSSGILIAAEGIELRFTDLIRITITEMGIDFVAGPTRMSLSPEAGFSVSVAGVSEMRLTAEDLNVRSVSGMLDFAAAYELVALSLKETMAATSERAAAVLRDV